MALLRSAVAKISITYPRASYSASISPINSSWILVTSANLPVSASKSSLATFKSSVLTTKFSSVVVIWVSVSTKETPLSVFLVVARSIVSVYTA